MGFPTTRMRRLRSNENLRRLVRETRLSREDLILPLFVVEGLSGREEISSMPGVFRFSVSEVVDECKRARDLGIPAVILFGIPNQKDARGSGADAANGVIQEAVSAIRQAVGDLCVITDVCLCEYTDHGHCGVVEGDIVKNDPSLPRQAIDACLALGGLRGPDLDRVVFYENPYRKLERILVGALGAFPRGARFFRRALRDQLGDKLWVLDELAAHCGVPRARVDFVAHHASHAASALDTAPFGEAVALTIDGVGEAESTAIWRPGPGGPEALTALEHPHSLGLFYAAITAFLGFRVNEGEYKVMGLAAFGEPRFREALDRMVTLHDDGAFTLRPDESRPGGVDVRREEKSFLDVVAESLGLKQLRVVETGGDAYEAEREQWDDGNNVVCLEPGVVIGYDRNTYTNTLLRKAGVEPDDAHLDRLDDSELALVREAAQFPRVVEAAAKAREPHRIAFFLGDLAAAFHSFWNAGNDDPAKRIIQESDAELTEARLFVAAQVGQVIRNGLGILGVEAVEEM